jgi:hypothetical protein
MPKDCWIEWDLVMCIRVFSDRLILEGALRSSDVNCYHGTRLWHSMIKSERRVKAEMWGLAIMVWVFVVMRNLLDDLWLVAAALASEGDNIGIVLSPTFQGKNLRYGLNWLCVTMALLKALFCERGSSRGWKPMIYDQVTMVLLYRFVLGGVTIKEVGQNRSLLSGFSFLEFFFFCYVYS